MWPWRLLAESEVVNISDLFGYIPGILLKPCNYKELPALGVVCWIKEIPNLIRKADLLALSITKGEASQQHFDQNCKHSPNFVSRTQHAGMQLRWPKFGWSNPNVFTVYIYSWLGGAPCSQGSYWHHTATEYRNNKGPETKSCGTLDSPGSGNDKTPFSIPQTAFNE